MAYKFAVIGANGLIGHEIIACLAEDADIEVESVVALTHKKQSGRELSFGDQTIKTADINGFDFASVDCVFYTEDYPFDKDIASAIAKAGAYLVDMTGGLQFDGDRNDKIAFIPSSRALQLLVALQPLHAQVAINRVHVATYESVSTEGKDGMDELFNLSRKFFVSDAMEHQVFTKQIAFNVIPQIEGFMDDGQTQAEWRMNAEVKKYLGKTVKVSSNCVQVPVFMGTGIAVTIDCDDEITRRQAKSIWRECNETVVIDVESEMEFVTPAEIAGEESVFISRVRHDSAYDNGLSFWCASDGVRLSATQAISAAKRLLML